ncbi:hypothetical protein D9M72_385220 [compost metagenome]
MLALCVLTVLPLSDSVSAISLMPCPSASIWNTCSSRAVSRACGKAASGCRACPISLSAIAADTAVPPRATLRMAPISWSDSTFLVRYPAAPARIACTAYCDSRYMLSTSTGNAG